MVSKVVIISVSSIISLIVCSVSIAVLLFVLKSSNSVKVYYIPIKNYIFNWINYVFRWLSLITNPQEFLGVKTKLNPCDPKYDDDGITCWSKPGYGQIMRNPPLKKGCNEFDDRFRDDGTSCWLDTYGNGVGTIPEKRGCDNGQRDDGISCWDDLKITGGNCWGGECKTVDNGFYNYTWGCLGCYDGKNYCRGDCYKTWIAKLDTTCTKIECAPVVTTGCGCIKKALWDRQYCPDGKVNIAGLCYNQCRPGYHFVGGNLCEPDGGPGIKKTLFDRQYCPQGQHMDDIHAFCYDDCKPGWRSDGVLMCVKNENSANTIIPEIKVDMFTRSTCTDNEKYKLGPGNLLCYPIFPTIPVYNKDDKDEVLLKMS